MAKGEIVYKYKIYITKKLENNTELQSELLTLKGKHLGCWCYPDMCHGNVLIDIINSLPLVYKLVFIWD